MSIARASKLFDSLIPRRFLGRLAAGIAAVYLSATLLALKKWGLGGTDTDIIGGSDLLFAGALWVGGMVVWEFAGARAIAAAWAQRRGLATRAFFRLSWPVYFVAELVNTFETVGQKIIQRDMLSPRPWAARVRMEFEEDVALRISLRAWVSAMLGAIARTASAARCDDWAVALLLAALAANPRNDRCWEALGEAYEAEGDVAQSLACYQNLARLGYAYEAVMRLG